MWRGGWTTSKGDESRVARLQRALLEWEVLQWPKNGATFVAAQLVGSVACGDDVHCAVSPVRVLFLDLTYAGVSQSRVRQGGCDRFGKECHSRPVVRKGESRSLASNHLSVVSIHRCERHDLPRRLAVDSIHGSFGFVRIRPRRLVV